MSKLKKYSREDHEMDIFRRVQYYRAYHPDYTQEQVAENLRKEYPGEKGFSRTNIRRFWNVAEFYKRKRKKGETLDYTVKKIIAKENKPAINKNKKLRKKSYFNLASVNPAISKVGIATVYDDDKSILKSIWKLYLQEFDLGKSWFECDLTFSKGDFYKIGIPCPRICFDEYPIQPEGLPDPPEKVYQLEEANQKLKDDSVSSIVIDLPQKIADNGKGSKDAFPNVKELVDTYNKLLGLAYKKLKSPTVWEPGGVVIIKVGDIDYKGQRIWLPNLVIALATGVESGLYDPISAEFEKYNPYDFTMLDKFIHLYKDIDLQETPKGRSIKAHDYFLVFSKGEKKEEVAFYFLSDEKCKERLAGSLCMMNNYHYVSDNLAKLKKEISAEKDFNIYKVRFKNKTLQNTISTQEKVNENIKIALSGHKIPEEMYDNGNKFLLYLENKIKPFYPEDFNTQIMLKNIVINSLKKDKYKILEWIKIYEEKGFDRKKEIEKEHLEKVENKIRKLESDISYLNKRLEKFSTEENKQIKRLEKTITSVSESNLNKLRQAGLDYVEIIYNKKGNKKIIILSDENLEIELLEENIKNNLSLKNLKVSFEIEI